jgi:hypothetical protein
MRAGWMVALMVSGTTTTLHSAMQGIVDTRVTVIPFSGFVKSGESFTKDLGNGSVLKISPDAAPPKGHPDGWSLEIVSDGNQSHAELMCLPLHGCNNCMIDPGCLVFSLNPDKKLHLPQKWTIEIGTNEPSKKMGALEFTIKDLKMKDANKKDPAGGYPLAWFSHMQFEGNVTLSR